MENIYIKLDKKSSLFKALKQKDLIEWGDYVGLNMKEVPRIGESFVLPYDSLLLGDKANERLKRYLHNRKNNRPVMRVDDIIIHQLNNDITFFYLKCTYILDTLNWFYHG